MRRFGLFIAIFLTSLAWLRAQDTSLDEIFLDDFVPQVKKDTSISEDTEVVTTSDTIRLSNFDRDTTITIEVERRQISDTVYVNIPGQDKPYVAITQVKTEPYIAESIPMITADDLADQNIDEIKVPGYDGNGEPYIVSPVFSVRDEFQVVDFASQLAYSISTKELRKHLNVIASKEMEGRETGSEGQKRAAGYIAKQFSEYELLPINRDSVLLDSTMYTAYNADSTAIDTTYKTRLIVDSVQYLQKITLIAEEWEKISLSINDTRYRYLKDYYSFPKSNRNRPSTKREEVVFLGYGIDDENYNDYAGVDVKDKIILIYQGEPQMRDGTSHITGTKKLSEWSLNWDKKLMTAKRRGVRTVLMIEKNIDFYVQRYEYYLKRPHLRFVGKDPARKFANSIYISQEVAKDIIGNKFEKVLKAKQSINDRGLPQNITLDCSITIKQKETDDALITENVVGLVEGEDPYLKNEIVVLMAHYDHLGMQNGEVYYGADDNGSGVSGLLEVAEAFSFAKRTGNGPRRSVLIMATTAEEQDQLGAEYFSEEPTISIPHTIAAMNMDMIGRVDEYHEGNPNYVYIIGADRLSTDLHRLNEEVNDTYTQLELDYRYNEANDPNRFYFKADHYHFAQRGIPSIFYFNGIHRDYHRITDTVDKINFKKVERISRLVFITAWRLANQNRKPVIDNLFEDDGE